MIRFLQQENFEQIMAKISYFHLTLQEMFGFLPEPRTNIFIQRQVMYILCRMGPSWPSSYDIWIYNYLCN